MPTLTRPGNEVISPDAEVFNKSNTLVDIVRWHARENRDHVVITFLEDGESVEQNLTYGDLDTRAIAIAARLLETAKAGDRALLVYESGLEYVCALVGCFYAGVIAVPVYPPDPMRVERTFARLNGILGDANAAVVLSCRETLDWAGDRLDLGTSNSHVLATDEIDCSVPQDIGLPEVTPDQVALLQYTSGSTAELQPLARIT